MSSIFDFKDLDNFNEDLNIDTLFDGKKSEAEKRLEIYNKVLQKIHNKIKMTARQNKNEQWCWFQVPMFLLGSPGYNFEICIEYTLSKLRENGFVTKLMRPNLILISWKDWVPAHVRNEIKAKMGTEVDGFGNIIVSAKDQPEESNKTSDDKSQHSKQVTFKSTDEHTPMKNVIYDSILLEKLKKHTN